MKTIILITIAWLAYIGIVYLVWLSDQCRMHELSFVDSAVWEEQDG